MEHRQTFLDEKLWKIATIHYPDGGDLVSLVRRGTSPNSPMVMDRVRNRDKSNPWLWRTGIWPNSD